MKKIGVEEHFVSVEYRNYLHSRQDLPRLDTVEDENHNKVERLWRTAVTYSVQPSQRLARLTDVGEGRLAEMDRSRIDMQVLSLSSPGVDELDPPSGTAMAKKINDELAEAVSRHPDRLAGFASIAPGDPQGAADELERAVKKLGLRGAAVNSHGRGEFLDDRKYWPMFEMAQKLDVPIYLHPTEPPPSMIKSFANYPILSTAMWGYAAEAGLHAMRLICSGLFDEYPGLKIILGHLGEAIPFWLWRIDNVFSRTWKSFSNAPKKKPGDYFKSNFYVTTSGMFGEQAFLSVYLILGADRILFAVDYPYENAEEASRFIEAVPICDGDKEKISHLNAEKLLKL